MINTHLTYGSPMKVRVTARDIKRGMKGDIDNCPIALALRRHKGMEDAEVGGLASVRRLAVGSLPLEAVKFVGDFDAGKRVKPFEFELKL